MQGDEVPLVRFASYSLLNPQRIHPNVKWREESCSV